MLSRDQHFLQTIYIIHVHLRVLMITQVRFGPERFDRIGETGNNLISYARDYDVFGFLGLQLFIK